MKEQIGMIEVVMRMEKEKRSEDSAVRKKNFSAGWENHTGIPTQLKNRIEQDTGLSLHDVRVHYNSELPARLDALAYTRGNQIEIAPGQERHLPHELGHVVQQKLGVVRANAMHSSGVALNTDPRLEHQADEIGAGKRVVIAPAGKSEIIQCARRDRKKERWKQGRGRLNWKHGRKNGFDMKHSAFEEDIDENAFRPIVSERLREVNFDETHYMAPESVPMSLYCYKDSIVEEFEKKLDVFFEELMCTEDSVFKISLKTLSKILPKYPKIRAIFLENCNRPGNFLYEKEEETGYVKISSDKKKIVEEFENNINGFLTELHYDNLDLKISRQELSKILPKYPVIRELYTGNCGEMANFLYEVKGVGEEESHEGDFEAFIEELGQEVPKNNVKLIKVDANIGHEFTLICYKMDNKKNGKTVIELIQAWQDEYSVRDSLRGGNIFINDDLIRMFGSMHRSIRENPGEEYFKKVFLLDNTKIKKTDKFDLNKWDVKILVETPQGYAEQIASKEISSEGGS